MSDFDQGRPILQAILNDPSLQAILGDEASTLLANHQQQNANAFCAFDIFVFVVYGVVEYNT
mgnify:CR=1 FL=1